MSILRALADVRVEEEFPATLECELSRQNVEVRWFKVRQRQQTLILVVDVVAH